MVQFVCNKQLLIAKMTEKGITRDEAAKILNISRTALENKLNNDSEFRASEIAILSKALGISRKKDDYFFVENVAKTATKDE